ncbi:MAG: helix-turn-helix domain-containing protein [Lachnospiraceae bacterium]
MSENIVLKSRKYRNLTQQELANIMGTDRARLSKIESGNANPTVALLEKIADALDMTLKIEFVPNEKAESKT